MGRFVCIAFVFLASFGCGDDTLVTAEPFVCTPETCPNGSCKLEIEFADNCSGQVEGAEVFLGGALEPGTASFGTTYASTGDIPVSESHRFWIRTERWQWGPLDLVCEDPAKDGAFTLSCCNDEDPTDCEEARVTAGGSPGAAADSDN